MPFVQLASRASSAPLLFLTTFFALATALFAQSGNPAGDQSAVAVIKATSRLVTLEVVARDRQGHPVPGLTAKDFEVFEQIPPKKDRHPQTISSFRFAGGPPSAKKAAAQLPPGVYSNLVNQQNIQVAPTVLLFDGINTELTSQLQVHHQMVKILASIPPNVPVAVFLMADRLRLLQSFTTDPKLLREAAAKALVPAASLPFQDPRDDPNALSAMMENVPSYELGPGALASLQSFEQQTYSFALNVRVQTTLDTLRGIARYLNAYPGRKNILWISSSFPLTLWSNDVSIPLATGFQGDMQEVGGALMDAKIAIYPMDPGGLQTQSYFEASSRVRQPKSGSNTGESIQREDMYRLDAQQTMTDLADQTGGRVCVNSNDLGDCVRKAVADSSAYYELAYYPDTRDWNGEYHRILLKSTRSGVHLSYREGYYAQPPGHAEDDSRQESPQTVASLQRAACEDPMTSTGITLMAKAIPADQPSEAKYFLAIESDLLTFTSQEAGTHELGISIAVCTFDPTGHPLQFLQKNSLTKMNEQEFTAAAHGITQTFQFAPNPGATRVRLLVRDSVSGRLGSVDVPYSSVAVPAKAQDATH
jgi:VWFA-related protein